MECSTVYWFDKLQESINLMAYITVHYRKYGSSMDLISILYQNFECSVLMERNQTKSFSVWSGVRKDCILPPILNIALDYIIRQTTQNAQHGIQWTLFSQLEDLDYENDIALLPTTANHLQKKAQLLTENARKTVMHQSCA